MKYLRLGSFIVESGFFRSVLEVRISSSKSLRVGSTGVVEYGQSGGDLNQTESQGALTPRTKPNTFRSQNNCGSQKNCLDPLSMNCTASDLRVFLYAISK